MARTPTAVALALAALLIAGCTSPEGGAPDGDAPGASTSDSDTHPDFPGMVLEATFDPATRTIHAEARNEGDRTYRVQAMCVGPWRESMRDASGDEVQPREPRAYCAAFGLGPFPPGETSTHDLTWDGRLWDGNRMVAAPEGDYRWSVQFEVFGPGEGAEYEDRGVLEVTFTVRP
jgi:hypothetical protein